MNSLYGQSVNEIIDEQCIIGSENCLLKNNDERVVEYEALTIVEYVIINRSDPGVDKKTSRKLCLPV